ncbi:MAG: YggS family pyridoxal phosphate-dependent enzyme [Phycisphaerales bacterium]|nr:YggS family pyridoxal phosphate-dependent enzyme [Phycisphaerales bacterium]
MTTLAPLKHRYTEVMERVAQAARASGRRPEDILVVAVTKYAELDDVRELIQFGHRDFGESRVQQLIQRAAIINEMIDRQKRLPGVSADHRAEIEALRQRGATDRIGVNVTGPVRWHMIGHLQRNKVRKTIEAARLIHSVDSLRLVEEIQAAAFKRDVEVDVLVQVNCSGEEQKYGCAVAAAPYLCEQIDTMVHLRVRGLMTMAPLTENEGDIRRSFERCADLFGEIQKRGIGEGRFNILSMGMTHDFELAIEHGANMVRIGSAFFGDKQVEPEI